MQTIKFNTGRLYTAEGQFIVATLHDDGVVTFMDHSRKVSGEFLMAEFDRFSQETVMWHYDHHKYMGSSRCWQDGMTRGGCNTR